MADMMANDIAIAASHIKLELLQTVPTTQEKQDQTHVCRTCMHDQ